MKKIILTAILLLCSIAAIAGGWTTYSASGNAGQVEQVEIVRAQGFVIFGDFGNPAGCDNSDMLYVAVDHPQYDKLYSMALTAFTANKKIVAYAHTCTDIGWHGGTINTLNGSGAMYLRN